MITTVTIIESVVSYGIVHGIWIGLKWLGEKGVSELRKERNRIIRNHVKSGHNTKLENCTNDSCPQLRASAIRDALVDS